METKKIETLIENIKNSNLSDIDKNTLIEILNTKNPDLNKFVETFISICKVGKEMLKLFDIDLGDDKTFII